LSIVRNRRGYHWFVVFTVCIGAFMAALDASIINVALPTLQQKFQVNMNLIEWVSLIYLLSLASMIITFGRIADLFGRRWMYTSGFLVFLFGSLMCGLASSISLLLLWRVVQAIGAAMLQANSVSIITAITPQADRGKAIGIQASAQGIGLSLGPAIGGALISYWDWRWLFFVNIPIAVIGTILACLLLPKDEVKSKKEHFDYWGFLFLTPSIVSLMYVLNMGVKKGWTSDVILLCCLIAFLGFLAFVREETQSKSPLVDFTLFKESAFTLGNLSSVMSFTIMYVVLLLTPFFMEDVLQYKTLTSAILLTIIPLGMTLFTPISGSLSDRFGMRTPTMFGIGFATLGCILLALGGNTYGSIFMIVGLFLVGAGMGMFTPPNNSNVMGSAPAGRLGIAGGILNMSRTIGMGLGVSLGGLSYQTFLNFYGNHDEPTKQVMILAFRSSYWGVAILGAITFLLATFRKQANQPHPDYFIGDGI
jgi:EmrB/QacA subfamily drug resistance transporter